MKTLTKILSTVAGVLTVSAVAGVISITDFGKTVRSEGQIYSVFKSPKSTTVMPALFEDTIADLNADGIADVAYKPSADRFDTDVYKATPEQTQTFARVMAAYNEKH